MALLSVIECTACGQSKEVWHGSGTMPPKICSCCSSDEAQRQRTDFLDKLKSLPLEERVARLEAWAFDYEKRHAATLATSRLRNTRF